MPARARRASRTLAGILTMLVTLASLALAGAGIAHADYGDRITTYDIEYAVEQDGSVHVTETITYQFASYGRHGIYRDLLVRVPIDEEHDRRYAIAGMQVSSTTGAETDFSVEQKTADDGRTRYASYQIGSAQQTVDASETYVLEYTVTGALNAQENADTEFYWNATGNSWDAQIDVVSITVEVPGGATQVACWAGPQGSSDPCDSAQITGQAAKFTHTTPSSGSQWGVTIDVGIDASLVDAQKMIVDRPTWTNQNGFTAVPISIGAIVLVGLGAFGLKARRQGRDKRFAGVPPGVVPDGAEARGVAGVGRGAKVVVDDGSIDPPVAFSPPRGVSPAEASYLRRPGHDPDQLSATILDLAHRGVLRVVGDDAGDSRSLQLMDRGRATRLHEQMFLDKLFEDGSTVSLSRDVEPGVDPPLHLPNRTLHTFLEREVTSRRWFTAQLGGSRTNLRRSGWLLALAGAALLVYTTVQFSSESTGSGLGVWGVVALLGGGALVLISRTGRGQGRSATGRAVMDQVDGFEKYLRTAEADQLRFEEGEDIFSKYLPWAVVFDVAERWSRICAELSAQGAIPAQPGWYVGAWDPLHSYLWVSSFNNHVGSAASAPTSVPSAASPGNSGFSGFGGGSGFSGGFSGGGGGGGGGGSW